LRVNAGSGATAADGITEEAEFCGQHGVEAGEILRINGDEAFTFLLIERLLFVQADFL